MAHVVMSIEKKLEVRFFVCSLSKRNVKFLLEKHHTVSSQAQCKTFTEEGDYLEPYITTIARYIENGNKVEFPFEFDDKQHIDKFTKAAC